MNATEPNKQFEDTVGRLARIGGDLAQSWATAVTQLTGASGPLNPARLAPGTSDRCAIPPACWLPRDLGEVHSFVCPGGRAVLRIRFTNCDIRTHRVEAAVTKPEVEVKVTPDNLTLSAMERGWFTATADVPTDVHRGEQFELLLWVVGCNRYFLRWIVEVGSESDSSCHEIEVEDCPDHVHHWYDHFYCMRPCFTTKRASRK